MSQDRFKELMQFQQNNKTDAIKGDDIRLNIGNENIELSSFEVFGNFQKESERLNVFLEKVEVNSITVEELKSKYSKATTAMLEKEVSDKLGQIIQQNQGLHNQINQLIKDMQAIVDQDIADFPNEPETRMKKQLLQGQLGRTREVMEHSQKSQDQLKKCIKDKIRRQVKHLDENLNEEEIEQMCENPEQVQVLLQQKMYGKASIQLQNAVADIQDKYKDIRKLEKSVEQVYRLFQDLAVLTYHQGEQVDRIEGFINQAHDYIQKAEGQQVKAKAHQQAAQKRMCCIFVIIVVILLIIIVPTLTSVL